MLYIPLKCLRLLEVCLDLRDPSPELKEAIEDILSDYERQLERHGRRRNQLEEHDP